MLNQVFGRVPKFSCDIDHRSDQHGVHRARRFQADAGRDVLYYHVTDPGATVPLPAASVTFWTLVNKGGTSRNISDSRGEEQTTTTSSSTMVGAEATDTTTKNDLPDDAGATTTTQQRDVDNQALPEESELVERLRPNHIGIRKLLSGCSIQRRST
jgi:hypothetical protein